MIRLCLVLMLTLQGCSVQQSESAQAPQDDTSDGVSMPTAEMLPTLKSRAIAGGKAEAMQLAVWYSKFAQGPDTFEYWTQIAAENGSSTAQYNLGQYYSAFGAGPYSKQRALFWYKKAAEQGDESAKEALKEFSNRK